MGQKQQRSEYQYSDNKYEEKEEDNDDYSDNKYEKKKADDEDKNIDNNNNEEEDDDLYTYEDIKKKLRHMNLTEQEVEDNYDFYKTNLEKLEKINKIITNVKVSNLYNLNPFQMLEKILPKDELKNLPSDYDSSDNKEEIWNEAPINPEYVVPSNWEDLFDLEISDKAIDKLYIASEIQKLAKNFTEWRGQSQEYWENKINEENYEIFKLEVNNFIKSKKKDNLKKLKLMNLSEEEIENNIWFYFQNSEKLIKVNEIINNIKGTNFSNLSPQEVLEKIVPENEYKKNNDSNKNLEGNEEEKKENDEQIEINPEYVVPYKWQDLFYFEISEKAIDKLYIASVIKKLVNHYIEWKGESKEYWEKEINEENYKNYEIELKNFMKNKKEEILKKLKLMKLSEQDVQDNFWFYNKNFEKLVKINDTISNIKGTNFKNLSPKEVLKKIVTEKDLTNIPSKWEDLYDLKTSDKVLDYLYIETTILMLATEFSYWHNENIDRWLSMINKNNYEEYKKELDDQKNDETSYYYRLKIVLPQLKYLEYFNKTEKDIRFNVHLYYEHLDEIIKISNIIKTAKISNLYELTPSEAYRLVNHDNPDYLKLPNTWEELFNLKVPEWKIDILYATTKNNIKNAEFEKNRMESNKLHEQEIRGISSNQKKDNKKIMNKDTLIKEIKKLRYFKVKESEIKKKFEYYSENFEELKKINEIIKNAKKAKIYSKTPNDFMKAEKGISYNFPKIWEDLFNLECETWKTDTLYNCILEKIERANKRQKEIKDKEEKTIEEMNNLKELGFKKSKIEKNIGYYMDHLEEFKKINEILVMENDFNSNIYRSTPMTIYKKSYKIDCDLSFPKSWYDLRNLNWTTSKIDELLLATKIEYIKTYLAKFKLENYLSYGFYDGTIGVDNYSYYKNEFDKYFEKYKRLEKTKNNAYDILDYIDEFYSGDDKNDIKSSAKFFIEEAKDMNVKSDFVYVNKYEEQFERVNKQIQKKKKAKREEEYRKMKERERREEERERRNMENRNYNNRSNNSSSSSSNNSDLKKSYIKLCRYCKNSCVSCKKEIKGSEIRTGKAFGLHNKCQINSCYICGTSKKGDDVMERQSSYLCKSCYNSSKLDWTKCLSCHKQFK